MFLQRPVIHLLHLQPSITLWLFHIRGIMIFRLTPPIFRMLPLICMSCTPVASVAQTTVPATSPALPAEDTSAARDAFSSLVQQGSNALQAGDSAAAIDTFLDAKQLFEKRLRGKALPIGAPEHIALLHGLALAYQLQNQPQRASPFFENNAVLDRACTAKSPARQLLVTRAVLDLTQGYLSMRTAVGMSSYLKDHPDELDSEILDLLFTALTMAESKVTNRALMLDPMIKQYDSFNKRLEATRSGQRRWGVQWVDQDTFDANMRTRSAALKAVDKAAESLDKAEADVAKAQANLKSAKSPLNGNPSAVPGLQRKLDNAQNRRDSADSALIKARAAIPPVPILVKEQYAEILRPHDVKVAIAKSASAGATTTADSGTRQVSFTLGGTATAGKSPVAPAAISSTDNSPPVPALTITHSFTRNAVAFAIGPDLFIAPASSVKDARRITLEFPNAQPVDATLVRSGPEGLALLRVSGSKQAYFNLSGDVANTQPTPITCPAFPEVSVFGVVLEPIRGTLSAANTGRGDALHLNLSKHPRLAGSPVLNATGQVIAVELASRDDAIDHLSAASVSVVRLFMASDCPRTPCGNPSAAAVAQLTATVDR